MGYKPVLIQLEKRLASELDQNSNACIYSISFWGSTVARPKRLLQLIKLDCVSLQTQASEFVKSLGATMRLIEKRNTR